MIISEMRATPIVRKLRERRNRYHGHVIRADEYLLGTVGQNIEVDGTKRPAETILA